MGKYHLFWRFGLLVAVILLMQWLPAGSAAAQQAGPQTLGNLSPPPPRDTSHPKLDSQLATITAQVGKHPSRELAAMAPLSQGESIAVTVRLDGTQPLASVQAYLTAHGATIANTSANTIEAYVPVTELDRLSTQPGVLLVEPILPPQPTLVVSQGTTVHNTPNWNAAGFNGSGIKVGIIDAGFLGITTLIASGELPTPVAQHCYSAVGSFVTTLVNCQFNTEHGAAVAETVLDVAPAVTLYIADPVSSLDTRNTVAWMISQGVQVINSSIGWLGYWGPGDGTSPIPDNPFDGVNDAVAGGITFVSSAGNDGVGSWTGPYSGSVGHYINYSGTNNVNYATLHAGTTYSMRARWADSWSAPVTDFDLYLFHWNGTSYDSTPVMQSNNVQDGTSGHFPKEFIQFTPSVTGIFGIALYHWSGPAPAWVQMQLLNGASIAYQNPYNSIGIPAESANPGMVAVGAAPYSNTTTIESFSSQGPTRDNRIKPDVVGADCGTTISLPTFCGTSQAAPYVAGLAALVRQRFPSYTPAQVVNYLKTHTIPRGSPVPNNIWGAGIAVAAMDTPVITPSSGLAGGGTSIQITSIGIGPMTTVSVGGNACTLVTPVSATAITCKTPAGTGGAATVTLATNGQTLSLPNGFTYQAPASLPGGKQPGGNVPGSAPLPESRPSVGPVGSPNPLPSSR